MSDAVLDVFETTLADCTQVQSFLVVASSAAAKDKIYKRDLPLPSSPENGYTEAEISALRPYILIYVENYEREYVAVNTYNEVGTVVAEFVTEYSGLPEDYLNTVDAALAAKIDSIEGQLDDLGHVGGYLAIRAIRHTEPGELHPRDRVGMGNPAFMVTLECDFGQ